MVEQFCTDSCDVQPHVALGLFFVALALMHSIATAEALPWLTQSPSLPLHGEPWRAV